MLALFTRSDRTRKTLERRSTTLFLERLEDRLSPSGMGPPGGPGGVGAPTPETVSLTVTYDPNKQVTLTGQLTGQSGPIANQTINLGGVVNGTATTNAQGGYSVTLPVSKLGQVTAASADGQSNIVQSTLVSGSPTINNFDAASEGSGLWYFSGTVTGAPTQGEVVTLAGIPALQNQQVNVNPDGTFGYFCIVNTGQGGWANAEATDWWGDTSPVEMDMVGC